MGLPEHGHGQVVTAVGVVIGVGERGRGASASIWRLMVHGRGAPGGPVREQRSRVRGRRKSKCECGRAARMIRDARRIRALPLHDRLTHALASFFGDVADPAHHLHRPFC